METENINQQAYYYALYQEQMYFEEEAMKELWKEARVFPNSVYLSYKDEEAVIYRGVKIVKNEDGIKLYDTDYEMYKRIYDTRLFFEKGFEYGVLSFASDKYMRKLSVIQSSIQDEISSRKNHKKISYLKSMRETLIEKYNEVTRRIKEIEG